jgi:predicted heme/steroid binding protein/uncharacterized membrane protein
LKRLIEEMTQRRFTISELKEFDGKEGRPSYIAFEGKVYDVSNNPFWKAGKHLGAHSAGFDLTINMMNAPHSEEVLAKFKVVGELIQEGYGKQKLVRRLQKLHLHSIFVHFSIAYSVIVPLLSFLYIWTSETFFETAFYYMLLLGLLASVVAGVTGIFSWKVTYEGRMTKMFSRKILLTIMLILVLAVSFGWLIFDPNILTEPSSSSYVYLALTVILLPLCLILGNIGGKIIFS